MGVKHAVISSCKDLGTHKKSTGVTILDSFLEARAYLRFEYLNILEGLECDNFWIAEDATKLEKTKYKILCETGDLCKGKIVQVKPIDGLYFNIELGSKEEEDYYESFRKGLEEEKEAVLSPNKEVLDKVVNQYHMLLDDEYGSKDEIELALLGDARNGEYSVKDLMYCLIYLDEHEELLK